MRPECSWPRWKRTTTPFDGAAVARTIRERVAADVRALAAAGVSPRLEVILVGDDPASGVYVAAKAKAALEAGVRAATRRLPATTGADELRDEENA